MDPQEQMKKVLVACEESQTVCKAFRQIGAEAYSCDIQPPSGGHPEWHVLGDALQLINGRCDFTTMDGQRHTVSGSWDILIAHPPCTFLTPAGSNLLVRGGIVNPERDKEGWKAKAFFEEFLRAGCQRIAVENPAPMKRYALPPYTQIIEPYYFGHPYKKRTCLWLKGLPPLLPTELVTPMGCWVQQSGKNCRTKLHDLPGHRSPKMRSKTFEGIAKAMAQQWGQEL